MENVITRQVNKPIKSCFVMRACVITRNSFSQVRYFPTAFQTKRHEKNKLNLCGIIHNELTLNWRLHDACRLHACFLCGALVCVVSRTHGAHSFVFIHSQKSSNFYIDGCEIILYYTDIPSHHQQQQQSCTFAAAKTVSRKYYASRSKQHFQIRRLQFLYDRNNVRMWRLVLSSNYRHQCQLNKFCVRVFFEHWRSKKTLS